MPSGLPSTSPGTLPSTIVILGTGGTIAGAAASTSDNVGYTAAQRPVVDLLAALPQLAGQAIEAEQVAQLDSKDMDAATWQRLARAVARQLARPEVAGVVVTHGTDTLEETAWLLQRVLAPARPVVLVAAMRPATSIAADGPQNLLDAVAVARTPGARGVVAVLAGRVHAAAELRKVHPYRTDAFDSGDAGLLGVVEEGVLRRFRDWPAGEPLGLGVLDRAPADWPWVEIVVSHAAARGDAVRALVAAGVHGLVVAATGNGTVHRELDAALRAAEHSGVTVWRCTRCAQGALVGPNRGPAASMSPWQARLELTLSRLASRGGG
ncbi:MAG: asparaginase [Burkholderiaceae bacterium]|nr:asparaginase [Burkholderiaceae bacterium]